MGNLEGRKRQRLSLVCSFCKKRKVKCDKGQPCSTCVRYGNKECNYDATNRGIEDEVNTLDYVMDEFTMLKEKVQRLEEALNERNHHISSEYAFRKPNGLHSSSSEDKDYYRSDYCINFLGNNPIASDEEVVHFAKNYCPLMDKEPNGRTFCGQFFSLGLCRSDNFMKGFWTKNCEKAVSRSIYMSRPGSNDPKQVKSDTDSQFLKKTQVLFGWDDLLSDKENKNCGSTEGMAADKAVVQERAMTLGLTFYQGILGDEIQLIERIHLLLPSRKVIWMLIGRFFEFLYPFLPLIDENVFRSQVSEIIGPGSEEHTKIEKLHIVRRLDFAISGLLLVVLRLSYLSLFTNITSVNERRFYSNEDSQEAKDYRFLLENPINIDIVETSRSCLRQFDLLTRNNLLILQLALFLRIYYIYAPEEGEVGIHGNGLMSNSLLVLMAISMGLHREPDNYPEICNDGKVNNLGRKIWIHLMILDFNFSASTGTPLICDSDMFDVKAPSFKEEFSNVRNLKIEKAVHKWYSLFYDTYFTSVQKLKPLLSINKGVKMGSFKEYFDQSELYLLNGVGLLQDYFDGKPLDNEQAFEKSLCLKIQFGALDSHTSISFLLLNHYESKGRYDLAGYYMAKIFHTSITKLLPLGWGLAEDSSDLLKSTTDLMITPEFEGLVKKSLVIISAIQLRAKSALIYYEQCLNNNASTSYGKDDLGKPGKVKHFYETLESLFLLFMPLISNLSKRYYYAWKIAKIFSFVREYILDESSTSNIPESFRGPFRYPTELIDELIKISERTLELVKNKKTNPRSKPNQFESSLSTIAPPNNHLNSTQEATTYSGENIDFNPSLISDTEINQFLMNPQVDDFWLQVLSQKRQEPSVSDMYDTGSNGLRERQSTYSQDPSSSISFYDILNYGFNL